MTYECLTALWVGNVLIYECLTASWMRNLFSCIFVRLHLLGLGRGCAGVWGGGIWRRVREIIRGSLFMNSMPSVLFYSPTAYPNNFWKIANCVMYTIKLTVAIQSAEWSSIRLILNMAVSWVYLDRVF